MADFNYKILTEITQIVGPSSSLYTNTATTASYVRSIVLHNTSTNVQNVIMWKASGSMGGATNVDNTKRFLNYAISGGATFVVDFAPPGLMITQSNDTIWASASTTATVNVFIVGGTEA